MCVAVAHAAGPGAERRGRRFTSWQRRGQQETLLPPAAPHTPPAHVLAHHRHHLRVLRKQVPSHRQQHEAMKRAAGTANIVRLAATRCRVNPLV